MSSGRKSPWLSLCMIARDSARTLPACLQSIRPWVGEMIVVDTGSRDETPRIAAQFGAQVSEFPWIDDFAAARNASLSRASGVWLFWMDSDDSIDADNGRRLKELANGDHPPNVLGYVAQVRCPASDRDADVDVTVVDHVKLIRNDPRIRFEGRIHEQILPSIRRLDGDVAWTDLFVVHSGVDHSPDAKRRKYDRDLRILHLDLLDRPDHPFVLFNLGMTYDDMGEWQEAEGWLRKCLAVSSPQESHVRKAHAILVSCLDRQGRTTEARAACLAALNAFPQDRELSFRLGILEHQLNDLDAAVRAYRSVLRSNGPRHFTSMDAGIVGYKTRHNLAIVHEDRGELDLSELQWRMVLDDVPTYGPARRALGRLLIRIGRSAALQEFIDGLSDDPSAQADARWLVALTAERSGNIDSCCEILEEVLSIDPRHQSALTDLARLRFHFGSAEEAESAFLRLLEIAPNDAATFHNLGLIYVQIHRYHAAVEAFEQSLRLRPNCEITQSQLREAQAHLKMP